MEDFYETMHPARGDVFRLSNLSPVGATANFTRPTGQHRAWQFRESAHNYSSAEPAYCHFAIAE